MEKALVILPLFFASATLLAQSADTGTAHKAAATALLNSNNRGAAHLACPASIFPLPTANPPAGGPPRAAGPPGGGVAGRSAGGPATTPPRDAWYAEGGQVFDNLYLL